MDSVGKERLLEQVQNDLKNISLESKRSKAMQNLREATEEAIVNAMVGAETTVGASGFRVLEMPEEQVREIFKSSRHE